MEFALIVFPYREKNIGYEESRLLEEAKKMDLELPLWFASDLEWKGGGLFHKGEAVPLPHCILVRAYLLGELEERLNILVSLRSAGVTIVNQPDCIAVAKNKIRTINVFKETGVAYPKSEIIQAGQEALLKEWNYPLILKEPYGSYGHGVILAETERSARSILDALFEPWGKQKQMIIQEFISEAQGADHRLFVVKGQVIAAMKRQAQDGEFRANAELGGICIPHTPTPQQTERALLATKALGLEWAGVDILESSRGPLVLEVNANPGFKALEKATGTNIAEFLLQSL